jgi:RNA polymerase sigma-70 factor (ECF subfamily)
MARAPKRLAVGGTGGMLALGGGPAGGTMDTTRESLLLRARGGDTGAWHAFMELYRPLIVGWVRYQGAPAHAVDDLVQDILLAVVQSLPSFQHSGNRGAFRAWLRTLAQRHTCDFWRARRRQADAGDAGAIDEALRRLEDPASDLNRHWDEEHDRYVVRCLLDLMELEFEPATVRAFRRVVLDGAPSALVAQELGMSVGAVYTAKCRVLGRLREEAQGLVDFP